MAETDTGNIVQEISYGKSMVPEPGFFNGDHPNLRIGGGK